MAVDIGVDQLPRPHRRQAAADQAQPDGLDDVGGIPAPLYQQALGDLAQPRIAQPLQFLDLLQLEGEQIGPVRPGQLDLGTVARCPRWAVTW
jgi:hypothetical protein